MKKIMKSIFLISLAILMCITSLPIYATDTQNDINPRLSHMNTSSFSFSVDGSGGYAQADYIGYSASFVQAKITIKVQKRFLWVFWNDVGEWSATSTSLDDVFYHVFSLNGSGTYRAEFTLEVTGTDGTVDVVTDTLESSY